MNVCDTVIAYINEYIFQGETHVNLTYQIKVTAHINKIKSHVNMLSTYVSNNKKVLYSYLGNNFNMNHIGRL